MLELTAATLINPMILKRFRQNLDDRSIRDLYSAIVAQARSPAFYTSYGVPDTVHGRFDLIVLHLVLLLARLDREAASARGIGQKLFDLFCRDLDANLREMGVGDLAVPKRMRHFGEAFYGRHAPISPRSVRLTGGEVHDRSALLRGAVVFPKPEAVAMPEPKSRDFAAPWRVPVTVEELGESGQHFDLIADAPVRAAVAKVAGLRDLPRFEASFDVTRRGSGGLHVTGSISATVGQNCVVTLEPLANELEESIDLIFEPPELVPKAADKREGQRHGVVWNDPEPLVGGVIDLGALAIEFLILGLDPYPRKPGAVFEAPQNVNPDQGPFAALGRLAKRQEGH
jgi:hypothetical protein